MATKISFVKDSTSTTKPEFYKAYILGKQHKVHSKKSIIDITDEPGVRIHEDLFDNRNILSDIGGYWYWAIFINEAIRMRFFMIIKSKDSIYEESKIVFNKNETYKGKRIQYFRLDDTKKYQLLVPYFDKKEIIWKKSALYAQRLRWSC